MPRSGQGIGPTIGRISEIATAIASAVEEQSAEIANNVTQASKGTQQVSSYIAGVTTAAAETGSAANQFVGAASKIS